MDANSPRWHRVTPSSFPWEDEAINFLQAGIVDVDPNRGWSNFEFISGGVISEVDVFLLTRKGAFLIEIKSTPGRLVGDQQWWTFHRPDGGQSTMENPLLGVNRKAKRIKSLLDFRWRNVASSNALARPPFIQPVVFLSDPELAVDLTPDARAHVFGRDGSPVVAKNALPGIIEGVSNIGAVEANDLRFSQLNTPTTQAVAAALEAIGIKESNHTRRVGSWLLRLDTVSERPGIQDFVADHEQTAGVQRRIRIYSRQPQMSDDQATSLRLAADREFQASERIANPHVVRALDRFDSDFGAVVVLEHEPTAVRLDRWLASTPDIDIDDRMMVLRQLAETMQSVHRRKVTHRSLSPGSVLVRPGRNGEPSWVVLVTDFSLAGRDHSETMASTVGSKTGSRGGTRFGLPTAAPGDAELLADESALLFCAPELFTEDDPDGVSLDVFSFGAIAYEVLTGRPPGDSRESVREALRAGRGLQAAAVEPGVVDSLNEMVLEATRPLVSERSSSFDDVLVWLDAGEEELTAPSRPTTEPERVVEIDPLDAKAGDVLEDGAVVKRRLGRGSTALALLVDRGEEASPREAVYKVSLGGESDARLRAEGSILSELTHQGIVQSFGDLELAGRPVLAEAQAGSQSLSEELRRNGTPGIEFLERWGSDLLEALRYLEDKGRWHRDIKPDNLGVTEIGYNKEQHLVLFDFSLSSTPSSDVRAGTPPYLEPFLGDRPSKQWDLAAERYAAGVTLYEMATGELPRWGDGRSDPAFTDSEVSLDAVLFDPAARDSLQLFFTKALRRDPKERFGNAEEMLRAWQRVFGGIDGALAPQPGQADEASTPGDTKDIVLPVVLAVDDPLLSIGASGKVLSALNRLGASTVRQLADLAPVEVNRARRISPRVRRQIIQIRASVLSRFADDLAATTGPVTLVGASGTGELAPDEIPRLDLDRLAPLLVPPPSRRGANATTQRAIRLLLGLESIPGADSTDWPSQTVVAEALGVTPGRIGQIGPSARREWAELLPLRSVRDEIVEMIATNGGVVAVGELEQMIADVWGTGLPPQEATVVAGAVVRAAVEAEEAVGGRGREGRSRLVVRRRGDRVIVALNADSATPELDGDLMAAAQFDGSYDGQALGSYAAALGDKADDLVGSQGDVVPQDRAVAQLRQVETPKGMTLGDGRIVRLAASCSQRVGVSSALELYPLDIDPVRAIRLARQSLAAAADLTVDDVRSRIQTRFPRAKLPDRPELDRALVDADVAVTWAGDRDLFVRHSTVVGELSSMTSVVSRYSTRMAGSPRPSTPAEEIDPALAVARDVEGRLQRSLEHGGFLALRVPTSRGPAVQREMSRFTSDPYRMVTVDLERLFLDELKASALAKNVAWQRLISADLAAEGSTDFVNLRILTRETAARLEARVLEAGPRVLAWNPGILAAYGELDLIDRVRGRVGLANSELQTFWLVVFGSTSDPMPMVGGQPLPVLGLSEWMDLPEAWLRNRHGEHLPTGSEPVHSRGIS